MSSARQRQFEQQFNYDDNLRGASGARQGGGNKLVLLVGLGVVVVLFLAIGHYIRDQVISKYQYESHWIKADKKAKAENKPQVVIILGKPRENSRFRERVLKDDRIEAYADKFVWLEEMPSTDNTEATSKNRDGDYAQVSSERWLDTTKLPHVLVYTADGELIDGFLGAYKLTPEEFELLLKEALEP